MAESTLTEQAQQRRQAAHEADLARIRANKQAWWDQQQRVEAERVRRDREATERVAAERQRLAEAQQTMQWEWAQKRNELRDRVAELRNLIAGAQGRIDGAPIEDAAAAASEKQVYERRLELAENEYAAHMNAQPRFYA